MKTGLKQRFLQAAGWMALGHVLAQAIRLGSSLVLTRLLAPELYGVMAVGYVVMTGLSMFSDLGLSQCAIQSRRGDQPIFLNTSWIVQIARGFVIAAAGLVVAGALGIAGGAGWLPAHSVYAEPVVPSLVTVVSLYAIISGFESTKMWLARRNLTLGALTRLELISQVATTVFQLLWAWTAPSVWTLAGGWLFGGLVRTALSHLWLTGPSNRYEWDRKAFREVFDFGKWVTLSSSFSFLLTSGDTLLLGALLDTKVMGAYSVAVMLMSPLQGIVTRLIGFAVLPALGEVYRERPERLRETIYRIRQPIDIACLVSAGALIVLAEPIVQLLYDVRYAAAGWMLSTLSLTLIATRLSVFDQCLVATARVRLLSLLNALRLVTLYLAIPIGYHLYGAPGAVYGVSAAALVNALAMVGAQRRIGLLDIKRELLAVPLFSAGLLAGWVVLAIVRVWK